MKKILFATLLLLFTMSLTANAAFLKNLQATKVNDPNGCKVVLTWELDLIGQNIGIFRGSEFITILPGDSLTWEIVEAEYGLYDYTVVWIWNWQTIHLYYEWLQANVNIGVLAWDHPAELPDGYLIYLSEIEGVFELTPALQVGLITEVPLSDLLSHIVPGTIYYAAAASYEYVGSNMAISELVKLDVNGLPVSFSYVVKTWELKKPSGVTNLSIGD